MKPIHFDEANTVYAKNQPEYLPLPAHKTEDGMVTSCWRLSLKERIRMLITGRVYVMQLTFNRPLQPLLVSTEFIHVKVIGEMNEK